MLGPDPGGVCAQGQSWVGSVPRWWPSTRVAVLHAAVPRAWRCGSTGDVWLVVSIRVLEGKELLCSHSAK